MKSKVAVSCLTCTYAFRSFRRKAKLWTLTTVPGKIVQLEEGKALLIQHLRPLFKDVLGFETVCTSLRVVGVIFRNLPVALKHLVPSELIAFA